MCFENHKALHMYKQVLPIYAAAFRTGAELGILSEHSQGWGCFSQQREARTPGYIHVIQAGLRLCVSKQLWFEKIWRAVEWKEKLMRQWSPARGTTLPSAGHQGEVPGLGWGR